MSDAEFRHVAGGPNDERRECPLQFRRTMTPATRDPGQFWSPQAVAVERRACATEPSRQYVAHHVSMHVGEPEIAAAVAIGEPFVVDAE
jgi:hypothetical protein